MIGLAMSGVWLAARRPVIVWFQFSLMLGVLLAAYTLLPWSRPRRLVVDVHSKALRREGPAMISALVLNVKRWALGRCAAVIVTNTTDAEYARTRLGVEAMILPDPLPAPPDVSDPSPGFHSDSADVVFVCSFAVDEPIELICAVAAELGESVRIAVTGDPARLGKSLRSRLSAVARLTGFLLDERYWRLLAGSRCIAVLTNEPACLPCGAYEAISLNKRPIVADDPAARRCYGDGAIYVRLEAESLKQAILERLSRKAASEERDGVAAAYRRQWEECWSLVGATLGERGAIPNGANRGTQHA